MRFGVFASFLLHLAIAGTAFVTLPSSRRPDVEAEPYIPLELIRQAELDLTTSVPAAAPEPEEAEEIEEPDLPEPESEEAPEPIEEPEPAPAEEPEPAPAPEPEPAEIEVAQEPESEPEPEPTPEPPAVKPQRTAELDLDALSKLIDKEREAEQRAAPRDAPSETTETADRARAAIGAGDRLTASDEAKMRAAVERCWDVGAIIGAPEPEKLIVQIEIDLNRDGSLAAPPRVANELQINLSGNQFWRVARREAVNAVIECAPYDFLPQERYQSWKEFRMNFNPSQMVGR